MANNCFQATRLPRRQDRAGGVTFGKRQAKMTLSELAGTLLNGFHDSEVDLIGIDYSKHEVTFSIAVWVGDPSSTDAEARETYRKGTLTLSGMVFCIIEPPDPRYPYCEKDRIVVDTGEVKNLKKRPAVQLPPVPEGMFLNWIYVREWNSFIYVAAQNAALAWNTGIT